MKVKYKSHLIVSSLMIMVWILVACQTKQTSVKEDESQLKQVEAIAEEPEKNVEEVKVPEVIQPVVLSEEEKALKEKLITLEKSHFRIDETVNVDEYMADMIKHIGSAEGELRDGLIYKAFRTWIVSDWLEAEQINNLLEILLSDEKLMYGIGEMETDTIFTRSFSLLTLDSILFYNQYKEILSEEQMQYIATRLTEYLNQEKDCRGRVKVKGWAHGIAHAGDVASILAKDESLDVQQLLALLNGLGLVMKTKDHEYVNGEERRVYKAVKAILDRDLIEESELVLWAEYMTKSDIEKEEDGFNISHSNRQDFLKIIKTYIESEEKAEIMLPPIEKFLNEGNGA